MNDVKEKTIAVLSELSVKETISETDKLLEDLALDSLRMVELLVELEDTFGFELDESDMNPFDLITAADVIKLAERYTGVQNEQ